MKLSTGDIMLVKVNKFSKWYRALFAKGIQLFDRSFYHHAVLFCGGVFHEADTKVVSRPLSHYSGDHVLILELIKPLSESERNQYVQECIKLLDRKYDYVGAIFFQLLYRLTGLWFGRTGKLSEKRPFCSEHTLTPINKIRGYFADKYKISPGDIRRLGGAYYHVKFEGTMTPSDWQ